MTRSIIGVIPILIDREDLVNEYLKEVSADDAETNFLNVKLIDDISKIN